MLCRANEKAPVMTAWEAITVAKVDNTTRGRVGQDGCPLTKVVQHQGRKGQGVPTEADRALSKVAEVGVEGLGSGHCQEEEPEDTEGQRGFRNGEAHRRPRVEGAQDLRSVGDGPESEGSQNNEPEDDHRTEQGRNPGGAPGLEGKEDDEDGQGRGQDPRVEDRGHDVQALQG